MDPEGQPYSKPLTYSVPTVGRNHPSSAPKKHREVVLLSPITKVWLGELGNNQQDLIADSGSDITLISQGALNQMENSPKIRTGQKVNLVQVAGSSKIPGYVNLPIIFETDSGPVQIDVEAYMVKGMTTPVILGNDFADQFSISIVSRIDFGLFSRLKHI